MERALEVAEHRLETAPVLVARLEVESEAVSGRHDEPEIGTVEGLTTAPVLRDLSHRLAIELPITEGVCSVLSGLPLHELVAGLMGRRPTDE